MRDLGIIADGAVLIANGVIQEVGSSRRVERVAAARHATEINAAGKVVMPGFVDCDTHTVGGLMRAFEFGPRMPDYQSLSALIEATSRYTIQNHALQALEASLRHGVTTLELKSGLGRSELAEMKILRIQNALRMRTAAALSTFMVTHWQPEIPADEFIDWICTDVLPLIRKRRLAEFADICCEPGGFTTAQSRRYLNTARQLGFVPKIQAVSDAVDVALEVGAASISQLNFADERDATLLANGDVVAVLLPFPVFYAMSNSYAPARMLLDRGAVVALATGYDRQTASSQNMQTVIGLACREMRMTPAEAISAATINGAHAVRRSAQIGTIEAGKQADILILTVSDYREIPYHFGVNIVETTMKNGKIIWQRSNVQWPA
ncbi:MAG TPA: amidohydrolase family protein [Bryobacteraceae bacterium]|nr:amidohydrolase family protein [Bryobacteraceae bacterium]